MRFALARLFALPCKGFTRPECQPCPNQKDVRPTTYDSLGEIITTDLCPRCRGWLLRGEPMAWT